MTDDELSDDPRHYSTHDNDIDVHHYSIERVAEVSAFSDHKQDVAFVGGDAIGLPLMEYTVRVGDTLRFHWRAHRHVGRPMAVSVNGGPWVSYVMDDEDTENGEDRQP
jgi:hypothetical protein